MTSSVASLTETIDKLEKRLCEYPVVIKVSNALELRPIYVALLALSIVLLFLGILSQTVSYLVGYLHPAWLSVKAIESKSPDEGRQWLSYWVIFAVFGFIETIAESFIFWVPFYYILKVVFLLWLSLPQFRGATILYDTFIRKLVLQYSPINNNKR